MGRVTDLSEPVCLVSEGVDPDLAADLSQIFSLDFVKVESSDLVRQLKGRQKARTECFKDHFNIIDKLSF